MMLKEELKELYKAKPELIEEHKRLVSVLRSGSKKKQLEEASKQLKELKEMVGKADRCWEGYEPTPGKKPYEKGSCKPVEKSIPAFLASAAGSYVGGKLADMGKQEVVSFEKKDKPKRSWKIKIKGKDGYHEVKDVKDMGPQQHNSYILHDGSVVHHSDVEDLDISGSFKKSNYGPKGMGLYNPVDNIKRKSNRTGEVHENIGQNKAVKQYTSATHGTASQQASRQAAKDKQKSSKNPVKTMADMSPEEIEAIKAKYAAKSEDEISKIKAKYSEPKEIDLKSKIKNIKDKYGEKKPLSEEEKAEKIRLKYTQYLK